MKKDPREKALSYAYRLLNIRPRSVMEIRTKLKGKGYSAAISEEIIDDLKKEGQLCDFAFARMWIENRLLYKPKGLTALRYELKLKGVPGPVIDEAISEAASGIDECKMARDIAQERVKSLKHLPEQKKKKNIHDFLFRRGFKFETIDRVLNEL